MQWFYGRHPLIYRKIVYGGCYSVAEMQDTDLSTVMESGFFHALCFKM